MTACAALLASAPANALPGTWKLARGRAVTLRPSTDGILRVAHGRVWATVEGPHGRTPEDSGDHVLQSGRSMYVRAGQSVVMEAWNSSGASYFAWDPVCAPTVAARPRLNAGVLLQPMADLRAAVSLAGRALAQLASGLAQLGTALAQLGWHAVRGARPQGRRHGLAG
jgi:hypothetical protein